MGENNMEQKLREYIEQIFSTVPCTVRAVELKEEILQNLIDKYNDLISEGKSEQAAYNIAVASVGNINELLGSVNANKQNGGNNYQNPMNNEEFAQQYEKDKNRSALLTSIAVALYILCPVPCILIQHGVAGPILLFVMVAVATGLIIYKSMTKKTYLKNDDTMVEDFKEWNHQNDGKKSLRKAVSSAMWALILVAYFVISFATGAWYITWLIFVIGGAVEGIVKAVFDYVA